ncbi:MAG: hypothetical protein F6J92_00280 [Symploca sp. SIO1A3]|nr:hypothetical protein [Symploca sp. SIO1A3]
MLKPLPVNIFPSAFCPLPSALCPLPFAITGFGMTDVGAQCLRPQSFPSLLRCVTHSFRMLRKRDTADEINIIEYLQQEKRF